MPDTDARSLADLERSDPFAERHIGPGTAAVAHMLWSVGFAPAGDDEQAVARALDQFTASVVPGSIVDGAPLDLPSALGEHEALDALRALADRNTVLRSMIGLGYHDTFTPPVIQRNVLENPAWYTAYTPYQPEISQGRLEVLLRFQTLVEDLAGLPVANASMLDEATAAAEAMAIARRVSRSPDDAPFVLDADLLPQTVAVIAGRAEPLGIPLVTVRLADDEALPDGPLAGVLVQYPGASGRLWDPSARLAEVRDRGGLGVVAADPLALCLLRSPGDLGADVACGSMQRFGVPMGFGGPHAGYLAVRAGLERSLPGRLVGVSIDADGAPATRLALQTREQHIRREKATSNICTAQVLLAVISALYAQYHGPDGLRRIAARTHRMAVLLGDTLQAAGIDTLHHEFFDTVVASVPGRAAEVLAAAESAGYNLRLVDADHVGVSCDETTTRLDIEAVAKAFGAASPADDATSRIPPPLARTEDLLPHPAFRSYHSETQMLRELRRLADRDLALDRTSIPLGSCTMKLNATAEMIPITWPGFARMHPFAPAAQSEGYRTLIADLERWLCEITGYAAVSVQPNAGSQGELAGLLAIRAWHASRGDEGRDVCLIPSSAHGTNAASAVMAGMRVVVVACDERGDVDLADLEAKVGEHAADLAAIMVTYPSTHGVFEEGITRLCALVHDAGGQVYVDGANLNALVGLARPGRFGADVSHLNLHKTFCIPHGGGGPGVGPVAVAAHLAPFLPTHPLVADAGPAGGIPAISAAPWGSAGILPIPWAYIAMMGPDGLRRATQVAVLNANYVATRLAEHYPVLYRGERGQVAHECILDLRPLTKTTGVTVEDVAKRLIDYGFHAPTMSFPVAGTLMVEPTESEDLGELDRFCEAMIAIRAEMDECPDVLRNAPHTAAMLAASEWEQSYSRERAAYPLASMRAAGAAKYWSPVRRIDGGHGDRNLVCACPPVEAFA